MGRYILIFGGMIGAFALIYYREIVGNMVGEAAWMRKVGGIYNVIIIVALVIFFWCVAELTGTTSVLFAPVKYLLPSFNQPAAPTF
jgi:hypothetical protein